MVKTIVFPSSFFDTRKVDEDLQAEYDAVLETGLFDVVLFGYDKWFGEGALTLAGKWTEEADAVYRGWMMNGTTGEISKKSPCICARHSSDNRAEGV